MKKYHNLTILIAVILTFFSCSSDLDFNQANSLQLEPVFEANLTYFDIAANKFVNNGIEQKITFDAQDFEFFKDSFLRDNLKRTDFFFEIDNTINRDFVISIALLDVNDKLLYVIPFTIPAYKGTSNVITQSEIFQNAKLDLLKSTKRMGFIIAMKPGPPVDLSTNGSLKLRSSATIYLDIK